VLAWAKPKYFVRFNLDSILCVGGIPILLFAQIKRSRNVFGI